MAQSNGRDQRWRSRYDKPNKYEERKPAGASPPPAVVPVVVAKSASDGFQPRDLPTAVVYNPVLGETRRGRRRAVQLIADLHTASQVAEAARGYEQSRTSLEEAHQQRELAQLRRTQLPAKIELENLGLGKDLLQARTTFEAMVEGQRDERADRERNRQIDREDFETLLANRRAARLEAQARERAAEEFLAHAAEIGQRKAEADLYKAGEEALRNEAAAEVERRRRDEERQKRTSGELPQTRDEMPAPLAAHYATERKVRESRTRADELAEAIRQRAEAQGRELTGDEIEEIDALGDAAAGAEDTIRRGIVGDFDV